MMVPQVTKSIMDKIIEVHPDIQIISDPFVGSGTVLTETMLRGLSFAGIDINPLAVLLCRVKSGPFYIEPLSQKIDELKERIKIDKNMNIEIDFYNRNKWFTKSVQIWLSKIHRGIKREGTLWARRFFWVALAETVRITSNSRTSTFKLHI
jgi:site-specific DNA-methyltransferase (cytosine-N4-specific)